MVHGTPNLLGSQFLTTGVQAFKNLVNSTLVLRRLILFEYCHVENRVVEAATVLIAQCFIGFALIGFIDAMKRKLPLSWFPYTVIEVPERQESLLPIDYQQLPGICFLREENAGDRKSKKKRLNKARRILDVPDKASLELRHVDRALPYTLNQPVYCVVCAVTRDNIPERSDFTFALSGPNIFNRDALQILQILHILHIL